jgi:hypothetical protein
MATIHGLVIDAMNQRPLEDVLVSSSSFADVATTNEDGEYTITTSLPDSFARTVTLKFTKQGYIEQRVTDVVIQNDIVKPVPEAEMTPIGSQSSTSGAAANIVLVEVVMPSIFVKGSGGVETTDLTFEVRDDNGIPVDSRHEATVHFRLAGGPNAGEFLDPDTVTTDNAGRVVVTVNSGTSPGAVQVIAEIDGTTISSAPVPISITGWLPDQNHFGIAAERLNFAGYRFAGLINPITAYVGDKFSNPVPPQTSVQFISTGGIIEGEATTDDLGRAIVRLQSAPRPLPQGVPLNQLRILNANAISQNTPYFTGPGYALVTAQTVDENNNNIYAEQIVLFSGQTQFPIVTPSSFNLTGPPTQQSFSLNVSDLNGNPLVGGSSISVNANKGEIAGGPTDPIVDTLVRGPGTTEFGFTYIEPDTINRVTDVVITIRVNSQNGNVALDIGGVIGE